MYVTSFLTHIGHLLSFSATIQEVPILFPYLPMIENINFSLPDVRISLNTSPGI